MSETLITITTLDQLENLHDYLKDESIQYVAFDSETTGLTMDAEIVGWSVCPEPGIAMYVVLSYWNRDKQELIYTGLAKPSIEIFKLLKTKKLIMHNCNFDCRVVFKNFGIELIESVHTDTLELAFLLDENRPVGLKDLGAAEFGETATQEQAEMSASVVANGGIYMAKQKEIYKADMELLAKYGAKDTILTLNLFYLYVEQLFGQDLDTFFYDNESMPLMRGPTYQLNTTGLRLDLERLKKLEAELDFECNTLRAEIDEEITEYANAYPKKVKILKSGLPSKAKTKPFSIGSTNQLSWLLFIHLKNEFKQLTDGGRAFAKNTLGKIPYSAKDKRNFIAACEQAGKSPEKFIKCDKSTLLQLAQKYDWVAKLLKYKASDKMLTTYATGIQRFVHYGVIYPSFLQHGTTSGRYSSRYPNFQNLPRDDTRIKACVISRPGKVFVAADYSQLEPRVFASVSQDVALMECFAKGEDFYSVVGIPIFKRFGMSAIKDEPDSFASKHKNERQISKTVSLASAYGTTAYQQTQVLISTDGSPMGVQECQGIIDAYFTEFPNVKDMMVQSHGQAMTNGVVYNLYGRPRRIPQAMEIRRFFGEGIEHKDLPYEWRGFLNLAVNHRIQSTGASIVNRAAIAFYNKIKALGLDAKIVLQVHDEIIIECPEETSTQVAEILKDCMENTTLLPGVKLVAEPKIGKSLAECK